MVAQTEATFEALRLSHFTSLAQQRVWMPTNAGGLRLDKRTGPLKQSVREFEVGMPACSEEFETRLTAWGNCMTMVKMRFGTNPKLATIEPAIFARYWQYLKGPSVWGSSYWTGTTYQGPARASTTSRATTRPSARSSPSS